MQFVLLLVPCVIGTYVATLFSVSIVINVALLKVGEVLSGGRDPVGDLLVPFFLVTTAIYTPLVLCVLLWARGAQLRKTDSYVAKAIGARRVPSGTQAPDERQLYNIVREMAIAAGTAAPEVYVWDADGVINALTIGQSESDAALYVSSGAMRALSRDELQALVGHGMSQILNGDTALNVRLATYMYAFRFAPRVTMFFLASPFRQQSAGDTVKAFLGWLFFFLWLGLALAIVTFPQFVSARLLQFSISRERQKLADASALQFTRQPEALKAVFAKAIALGTVPPRRSKLLEDLSHSCFAAPVAQRGLWLTHPPLERRLRTLDPAFDLARIADYRRDAESRMQARTRAAEEARRVHQRTRARRKEVARLSEQLAAFIPVLAGVASAEAPLVALAPEDDVRTELLALLLEQRPGERRLQLAAVRELFGDEGLIALAKAVRAGPPGDLDERSVALDSLLPRLRLLPSAELSRLLKAIAALEKADPSVTLFEYAMSRRAAVFITGLLDPREPHGDSTLADYPEEIQVLLSAVSQHSSRRQAAMAYEAGMRTLGMPKALPFRESARWMESLDSALGRLDRLQPIAKELLLESLHRVMRYDRHETSEEKELIRVIAAGLHCPSPR